MVYKITNIDDISKTDRKKVFKWWSNGIQEEEHMVGETPESLELNLLAGFIVYQGKKIIGASGIFPARTRSCTQIEFNNQMTVELGSNYIDPEFRGLGLGKTLLLKRIPICKERNWFPVSVTTNPSMQHIFKTIGAEPMDEKPEFSKMRSDLCICKTVSKDCKQCPMQENGGWSFEKA